MAQTETKWAAEDYRMPVTNNEKLRQLFAAYVRARDLAERGLERSYQLTHGSTNAEKARAQYKRNIEIAEQVQAEINALLKD